MIICCSWTCLHHRVLSCTWTYLGLRSLAAPRRVYTAGAKLHRDKSGQKEPVLLMDVSTPQEPELNLDCLQYTTEACAASSRFYTTGAWAGCVCPVPGLFYTTESFAASARVCTIGPELLWTCLHYICLHCFWSILHRGLSCTLTFLDNRRLSFT